MSYLKKRHNTWYARMGIPEAARSVLGRNEYVRSLQTSSKAVAQRRVLALVTEWKQAVALAASTDRLKAEAHWWREALLSPDDDQQALARGLIADKAHHYHDNGKPVEAARFYGLATGAVVELTDHIESWYESRLEDVSGKEATVAKKRVSRMAKRFALSTDVSRKAVIKWIDEQRADLAAATVKKIIKACDVYWKYLQSREVLPDERSPFEGHQIKINTKEAANKLMRAYTATEVVTLHREASEAKKGNLATAIKIAAYTGFRQNEVCELTVDDVIEVEGVQCLTLRVSKTDAGVRTVPIHDRLKPLIEELRTAAEDRGDGYLLKGELLDAYGKRNRNVSKQFTTLKTRLGFGDRHDFHSLRRTVATLLEQANVEELHAARLLGHKLKTMSYGLYSGGTSLVLLKEAVSAIDYGDDQF